VNGATKNHDLPDASGYFGWKLTNSDWGYGVFALTLSFPPAVGQWDAELTRLPGGTLISIK